MDTQILIAPLGYQTAPHSKKYEKHHELTEIYGHI